MTPGDVVDVYSHPLRGTPVLEGSAKVISISHDGWEVTVEFFNGKGAWFQRQRQCIDQLLDI